MDPLTSSYAMLTPYQFASNSPIANIDLDGLEAVDYQWNVKDVEGTTQLKMPNYRTTDLNAQLLNFHSYSRANGNGNQPYKYNYSNYAYELSLISARGIDKAAFRLGFDNYLPKRFINHYGLANGNDYILNSSEVRDLRIQPIGIQGNTRKDRFKFISTLSNMFVGQTVRINNYSILAGAGNSGTLGNFTIKLKGQLEKTSYGFNFKGQMQIYDIWDFDNGSPNRPELANDLVRLGNKYLEGKPFEIKSEWIDVEQNSLMGSLNFFGGYDSEPINNRVSKIRNFFKQQKINDTTPNK